MMTTRDGQVHHMKLTASGQVSLPADVRRRWTTTRLKLTDLGDRIVVEPEPDNPFSKYRGIFAGLAMTSDEMREENRSEERLIEARKVGK